MDKHEQNDGRGVNVATHQPQDSTGRQHKRELLAGGIGQLLARYWLRKHNRKDVPPGTPAASRPKSSGT